MWGTSGLGVLFLGWGEGVRVETIPHPYHSPMRIALAPLNATVADFRGNAGLVVSAAREASERGCDALLTPELHVIGYPPRDLLMQGGVAERVRGAVERVRAGVPAGLTVLLGTPWWVGEGGSAGAFDAGVRPTNSVLVIRDGEIVDRYDKRLLPDYDVFDEPRYFRAGDRAAVVPIGGERVGLAICEDLWRGEDTLFRDRYAGRADPLEALVAAGATCVAVASASPFVEEKAAAQSRLLRAASARSGLPIVSVNAVGSNDDFIFDGHAGMCVPGGDGEGSTVAVSSPFSSEAVVVDVGGAGTGLVEDPFVEEPGEHLLARALILGIRDYARKSGFSSAALGVSGGIDSALVAALAVAALGGDSVLGVKLPSRYSSDHSLEDAEALAANLGMGLAEYGIEPAHAVFERTLEALFEDAAVGARDDGGLTAENVQSRVRGLTMMAVANRTGRLLLTTGNKSEHAVGYATLYGDQNGGLAPIADLYKTEVYGLARHLNREFSRYGFSGPPIPERTIEKAPSAELRPGQTDQDTLPPYEVLDAVLEAYIDRRESPESIVESLGVEAGLVEEIVGRVDRNEFKRFQLCVALKVRARAFGPGRRRPVVAKTMGVVPAVGATGAGAEVSADPVRF